MKLVKSLLLGSAAGFAAVAGAQAADLPSRKAAPVAYVKICDAYGAGFFYIPGTDTCLKIGGYVRAEYQYTPGHTIYQYAGNALGGGAGAVVGQISGSESTTGYEVRGRVDLDARTPTALGTARTYIKLRLAATSGIRSLSSGQLPNNGFYTAADGSTTGPTLEAAMVQWAGFTFGVAPENYAMMPSIFYTSSPWAGFPNGEKQIAYTATFGGGISATLALEDRSDWGYTSGSAASYVKQGRNAANIVGNIRIDQGWGWAALHGMIGNNTLRADYDVPGTAANLVATPLGNSNYPGYNSLIGQDSKGAWAIGATAMFNLPMLAPGDRLWLTANYTHGNLGAILSGGGLNVITGAVNKRFLGGILRADTNLVVTGGSQATGFTVGSTTGWNIAAAFTHYWAPQWRSNFRTGYVSISPPSSAFTEWGKGRLWEVTGSIIYSPVKDLDIGLEVQYASMKNKIQNPSAAYIAQGQPGLSSNGIMTRLRVQRSF